MEKSEHYWRILEAIHESIRYSNVKATAILTVYGILISLAYSNLDLIVSGVDRSLYIMVLAGLVALLSSLAIFFAFRSIQPRLLASDYPSVIFFNSITKNFEDCESYIRKAEEVIDSDQGIGIEEDLARQIHINARIASAKFALIRHSVQFFVLSLLLLLLSALVILFAA